MNHAELDHQVRTVLPAVFDGARMIDLAHNTRTLPPFEIRVKYDYWEVLCHCEKYLEEYASRFGANVAGMLDLVRDCLCSLHVIR